ncbi:branched-chain amino acid ABC transporter permease [Hoeflea prorocentri]|uniref:Branched-chain amino acid ABC transporter permease n=1 Tax=Hoeflea prorocentri TaxID=1922333 RepID=A0A9X3UH98_9HYPH|nr:branched-chain amino acid ABC transporter permease [Hoeflea prorocentri]MCY6381317.1 branched-chain amino acid ABC transporter permease [Hoeflea prorocentri]MDA5399117.1 branched-chain amino acid ABC transporter permease [Hoeflea prorocentri]
MKRETAINWILGLGLLAVPFLALWADETFYVTLATRVAILALAGVGLNLALGFGGMVSFGHAAFFGLGGYAAGILAIHAFNQEPFLTVPFTIAGTNDMIVIWIVAILVCALVAVAIGMIALRTSGVYFIMITLAFAQMIYYFAISWPSYGGEDGLSFYVRNGFPGLNTLNPIEFFLICYAALMLGLFLSARLRDSRFGAALQVARQNEVRLAATGIAPFNVRLVAYVISACMTGLAGALFADLNRFVGPSMLSWHLSGEIMIFVILGGVGRLFGPLAGAALFIVLEFYLGGITEHWQFFLGLILLCVVLFVRGGVIGVLAGRRDHG